MLFAFAYLLLRRLVKLVAGLVGRGEDREVGH
jgi:hypothetical protein